MEQVDLLNSHANSFAIINKYLNYLSTTIVYVFLFYYFSLIVLFAFILHFTYSQKNLDFHAYMMFIRFHRYFHMKW